MPSFREHNGRAPASLSANSAKDYRPPRTFAPIMRLYLPEGGWGRPNVCFSLHGHVEACVPLIAHPWPIHFVMLVPRSRQRESKLVPHHNGCLPPPPTSRRNDHSGIDRSVCGRTASCAFAARDANNQFPTFRHFPIGEIIAALLSLSLSLRKFAYSRYSSSNISTNTSLSRVKNGEESGDESREGDERHLGGNWQAVPFPFHLYLRAGAA